MPEKCQHNPLLQWSDKWSGHFNRIDGDALQQLDASAQGTTMEKSTIPLFDAGLSLFVTRMIEKDKQDRHYSNSLAYLKFKKELRMKKTGGEGLMQVTAKTFRK